MDFKTFIGSLMGTLEQETLVAVDIGASKIKMMVLDITESKPKLVAAGLAPTPANALKNNQVTNAEALGKAIRTLLDANQITLDKVAFSIPGPNAFTKKVTMAYCAEKDLANNIGFEANNYIPHNVNDVYLDYQVLGTNGTSTMDILLVAVKNDVIDGFVDAMSYAGLTPGIADIDFFAVENMFFLNYPEHANKTIALVDIGARFSSVSIVQEGVPLFSGDVSVGGRLFTDALVETLGMEAAEADDAKMGGTVEGYDESLVIETLDRTTDHIASELHRQLGFFWNASGTDRAIEGIYLSGGAARANGLRENISSLTGIDCQIVDPFKEIEPSDQFDQEYLDEIKTSMGVSVGLAGRRFADKVNNLGGDEVE